MSAGTAWIVREYSKDSVVWQLIRLLKTYDFMEDGAMERFGERSCSKTSVMREERNPMRIVTLSLIVALHASLVSAGSFPTSISRRPLKVGLPSDRLSIGVSYEDIGRSIDLDEGGDGDDKLSADSASLYLGYDVRPWLTAFGTVGGVELDADGDTDAGLKVSAGLSAYLWEVNVLEPTFMAGRFSFKPTLEVSHYTSEASVGDVSWFDVTLALPVGYEIFDGYAESSQGISTSLSLYVGPAVSYVSGTVDAPGGDVDFDGEEYFGAIAGMDIYFSSQVSIGVQVSYFDETTIGGSLRFHL